MDEEHQQIVLPIIADGEDPFIPLWEFNISLRQFLTVAIGGVMYLGAVKLLTGIFPVSGALVMVSLSWIILLFMALAFIPKDGAPLEHYLTMRAKFSLSKRKYARIRKEGITDLEEFDWDSLQAKY